MTKSNKVAIITGGARGIGAGYAHALAREGFAIVVADMRDASEVADEIAEITGKKVGTVGWLISVGLKSLAGDLGALVASGARGNASSTGVHGAQSLPGGLS